MKVGTLTYHNTINYGAILQTYALQKRIMQEGIETEVIDYQCEAVENRYKVKKIKESKTFKEFIKVLLENKDKKIIKEIFDEFTNKYIKLSDQKYNLDNKHNLNNIYDKFIVGSDQIWNTKLSKNDYTYFLDFVKDNEKKYSYAASFGYSSIPENEEKNIKKYLRNFKELFVREQQGVNIIKKVINKNAQVTLDPTLLLDKNGWKPLIKAPKIKNKYILLYIVAPNKNIIKFAKKIAKERKCQIVYINHSWKKALGMKNIKYVSPEEYLGFIDNAECIITTSFHGVAFSINFNKEFYFALSDKKDNFNSRIENLISITELNNRNINMYKANSKIDYNVVNNILEKERIKSNNLLKKVIDE